MDRFDPTEEDRDALIADLAGKMLATRLAQLRDGDATVLREVNNSGLDYLANSIDMSTLVLGAAAPAAGQASIAQVQVLGQTFADVLHAVMFGEAEAESIVEVEAMECRRAESRDDNRIARAQADRVAA